MFKCIYKNYNIKVYRISSDKIADTSNSTLLCFPIFIIEGKDRFHLHCPSCIFSDTASFSLRKLVFIVHPAFNGFSLKSLGLIPTCPSYSSFSLSSMGRFSLSSKIKAVDQLFPVHDPLKSSASHSPYSSVGLVLLFHLNISST